MAHKRTPQIWQNCYCNVWRSRIRCWVCWNGCVHTSWRPRSISSWAHSLGIENLSRSQVSEMTKGLNEQVEEFRNRSLAGLSCAAWTKMDIETSSPLIIIEESYLQSFSHTLPYAFLCKCYYMDAASGFRTSVPKFDFDRLNKNQIINFTNYIIRLAALRIRNIHLLYLFPRYIKHQKSS